MQRDVVFYNSVNGAAEKASQWRTALVGVHRMLSSKLELDAASSSVPAQVCRSGCLKSFSFGRSLA